MAAELQVTLSATGFTSVVVWATKLDHGLDKPIIVIGLPDNQANVDDNADSLSRWESYLIDIGKVKEIITLQGMLIDDTTTSALEKKNSLFLLCGNSRTTTITWGTGSNAQTRSGNMNKVMITETAGIVGEQKTGYYSEKNFSVQLSFLVGTDE